MYDSKLLGTYCFDEFDFGGDANEVFSFRGPTGHRGRLIQIGVAVTEEFACSTTPANIQLGTAADNDAYALLSIPDETADEDFYDQTDDTDAILNADIPADTLLEVNLTQSTDGSADAGKGKPVIVIEWYK